MVITVEKWEIRLYRGKTKIYNINPLVLEGGHPRSLLPLFL